MGAPTETYVDPSIAANTGSGSVGDPYGDLQHALDTITRDGSNGDRINIKAGTDEVLSSALSLATYGTPSTEAPLIFQGYTSAAGDGGIGGISGGGSVSIFSAGTSDVSFIDLHLHNCGSSQILNLGSYCLVENCEVDNTSGRGITIDSYALVTLCHIHNIGGEGIFLATVGGNATANYLTNGTNSFSDAIEIANSGCAVEANIISIDGSSNGIRAGGLRSRLLFNSIYSPSGTGSGIYLSATNRAEGTEVCGNLIAGFDGSGGESFDFKSSGTKLLHFVDNATTDAHTTPEAHYAANNESSIATPFELSGSDTFANRETYFEPKDVGNVLNGAAHNRDKGAVQQQPSGGGGGTSGYSRARVVNGG